MKTIMLLSYDWYGHIDWLTEDGFVAILNRKKSPAIKATFKNSDVQEKDKHRIKENAIMRWVIYKDGSDRIDFIQITWSKAMLDIKSKEVDEMETWLDSFRE